MTKLLAGTAVALVLAGATIGARAPKCTVSTSGVAFGVYDVFEPSAEASTGEVAFRCSGAHTIRIELGTGAQPSFARAMVSSDDLLAYNLYLDATLTQIWGDGTGGTRVYVASKIPKDKWVRLPVYGRVPACQDVRAGSYCDALTVTFDF